MSDASTSKYKKHFHDSQGVHVPANTYLRGSKHGLVYYLNFTLDGVQHAQCLHVFEQEPDSWVKAANMSRRIILTLKARTRDMRFKALQDTQPVVEDAESAPSNNAPERRSEKGGGLNRTTARVERTINHVIQSYVSHHAQSADVSPTDRAPVRTRAHHLLRLMRPDALVEDLQGADLKQYINIRRTELVRDNTIRRELSVLECALEYAQFRNVIPAAFKLPPYGVKWKEQAPSLARKAKAREADLVAAFLAHPAFPEEHRLRYKVAYASGLRCHELMALTPSRLRALPEGGAQIVLPIELHNPASGDDAKERMLDADTYTLLMAHIAERGLEPSDTIFPYDSMMHRKVERVWKDMGLSAPITLGDLRSTFGTELALANGEHGMLIARDALGHKSIRTTEKYVQPGLNRLRQCFNKRMLALKPT